MHRLHCPIHWEMLILWSTGLDLAKKIEDMGADSICVKDMAGLLVPVSGNRTWLQL